MVCSFKRHTTLPFAMFKIRKPLATLGPADLGDAHEEAVHLQAVAVEAEAEVCARGDLQRARSGLHAGPGVTAFREAPIYSRPPG
jgi:hypothetical protein